MRLSLTRPPTWPRLGSTMPHIAYDESDSCNWPLSQRRYRDLASSGGRNEFVGGGSKMGLKACTAPT